jgi:hypothetical protein
MTGPPLTRSPASILSEAGVVYAISVAAEGKLEASTSLQFSFHVLRFTKLTLSAPVPVADTRIHDLALEASWAAKYAGLSEHQAVQLVSKNVEDILGLKPSKDVVVWENNPLQWGASVVLSFEETEDGRLEVATCWPDDSTEESF